MEKVSIVVIGGAEKEGKSVDITMTISLDVTGHGIEEIEFFRKRCQETFQPAFEPLLSELSNYMIAFIVLAGAGKTKLANETGETLSRKIREASQEILQKIRR